MENIPLPTFQPLSWKRHQEAIWAGHSAHLLKDTVIRSVTKFVFQENLLKHAEIYMHSVKSFLHIQGSQRRRSELVKSTSSCDAGGRRPHVGGWGPSRRYWSAQSARTLHDIANFVLMETTEEPPRPSRALWWLCRRRHQLLVTKEPAPDDRFCFKHTRRPFRRRVNAVHTAVCMPTKSTLACSRTRERSFKISNGIKTSTQRPTGVMKTRCCILVRHRLVRFLFLFSVLMPNWKKIMFVLCTFLKWKVGKATKYQLGWRWQLEYASKAL